MNYKFRLLVILLFLMNGTGMAQVPVEVFGGHERSTIDIMFFKFFRKSPGQGEHQKDRWLFFNRNRASIDYRMTETSYLPQFGFTEAISYNHEKLNGFAPVMVVQVLNRGVYPKAGIQYAHLRKYLTVFSWMVCETLKNPDVDVFLLLRYTPKLSKTLHLFTQVESVNTIPSVSRDPFSFTQRLRLGLQVHAYQFGLGVDLNQTGNERYTKTVNGGIFIRHEF